MSLENKEQSCALCHAYLFPEDDVVYCPECGAPHHRECYNGIGRCALSEFHGTENQYDKLKRAAEEAKAQAEPPKNEPPKNDYQTPFGSFSPLDFLGGVAPDSVIDDGVTARDAAKFVFSNTMRYIPKFARGKKASWNFLAFFFPGGWFLSRKMYKAGILATAIEIIATLLTVPFQNTLINLGITSMASTAEMFQKASDNIDKIPQNVLWVAFLGSLMVIALRFITAIFGDWFYKRHVVSQVREINANSTDKETDYRKKGGVNLFSFLLGTMAARYITALIVMFI